MAWGSAGEETGVGWAGGSPGIVGGVVCAGGWRGGLKEGPNRPGILGILARSSQKRAFCRHHWLGLRGRGFCLRNTWHQGCLLRLHQCVCHHQLISQFLLKPGQLLPSSSPGLLFWPCVLRSQQELIHDPVACFPEPGAVTSPFPVPQTQPSPFASRSSSAFSFASRFSFACRSSSAFCFASRSYSAVSRVQSLLQLSLFLCLSK